MNRFTKKVLCITLVTLFGVLFTTYCFGFTLVRSTPSKIVDIYTYSQNGNGDIVIQFQQELSDCPNGVWLSGNDPGEKNVLAAFLAARYANEAVAYTADKDDLWTGSSSATCHVYAIFN